MKIIKWLLTGFGIVVGLIGTLFAWFFFNTPKPDDIIEYNTLNYKFSIPYRYVVPGTLPNQPPAKGFDPEGPDIFIRFNGEYVKQHIPTFKLNGGKDNRYFRNVYVNLSDISETEKNKIWGLKRRFDPIILSGDFENGYVDYVEELGIYRVFRAYQGKKLDGFWDLVSIKPNTFNVIGNSYKDLWVGSCHYKADGDETSCSFVADVLGMYTNISASEDDYQRLNEIKQLITSHLQKWKATAM